MGKIEKSLELNITHELLSMADSFWWFIQPITLKRFWNPHFKFPLIKSPKPFASGLAISDEGKTGGGWDVRITSPSIYSDKDARLLFLQFKAGAEKKYSTNPKSHFHGTNSKPKIHVEFTINSNKNNDQHRLLQQLARKAGNKDAVAYVFPRIVNEIQMKRHLGSLCKKTSFIPISEMDFKARMKKVNIDDGTPHQFRIDYSGNKMEINWWWWFDFNREEKPGGIIGEIISIRMYRALKALIESTESSKISPTYLIDSVIRFLIILSRYFSITLNELNEFIQDHEKISNRINETIKNENFFEGTTLKSEITEKEIQYRMFSDIIKKIHIYLEIINSGFNLNRETNIPKPPNEYTIELGEEINFRIDGDFLESEMNEIYYQII